MVETNRALECFQKIIPNPPPPKKRQPQNLLKLPGNHLEGIQFQRFVKL